MLRLLSRRGFALPRAAVECDWSTPRENQPAVVDAWLAIHRDPATYRDLCELAEELVDLEYRFQQWRFSHMKTVERIIGFNSDSAGVACLAGALGRSFFPELFQVRTRL